MAAAGATLAKSGSTIEPLYELAAKPGKNTVTARATNIIGQTQTAALILNPAGYHHNLMQTVTLSAA